MCRYMNVVCTYVFSVSVWAYVCCMNVYGTRVYVCTCVARTVCLHVYCVQVCVIIVCFHMCTMWNIQVCGVCDVCRDICSCTCVWYMHICDVCMYVYMYIPIHGCVEPEVDTFLYHVPCIFWTWSVTDPETHHFCHDDLLASRQECPSPLPQY